MDASRGIIVKADCPPFAGIGLTDSSDMVVIKSVGEGGLADKAGVGVGDRLVSVNGIDTRGMVKQEVMTILSQSKGPRTYHFIPRGQLPQYESLEPPARVASDQQVIVPEAPAAVAAKVAASKEVSKVAASKLSWLQASGSSPSGSPSGSPPSGSPPRSRATSPKRLARNPSSPSPAIPSPTAPPSRASPSTKKAVPATLPPPTPPEAAPEKVAFSSTYVTPLGVYRPKQPLEPPARVASDQQVIVSEAPAAVAAKVAFSSTYSTPPSTEKRTLTLRSFIGEVLSDEHQVDAVLTKLSHEFITTYEELVECFDDVKGFLPALARRRFADRLALEEPVSAPPDLVPGELVDAQEEKDLVRKKHPSPREKFANMIKLQSNEELNEDLVAMLQNTALILALLLTITVPASIDVDIYDGSIWMLNQNSTDLADVAKAATGLVFFITSLMCMYGIRYLVWLLSQLAAIPVEKTSAFLLHLGVSWIQVKTNLENWTTELFTWGILLQLSISQPIWVFIVGFCVTLAGSLIFLPCGISAVIHSKNVISLEALREKK